MSRNRVSQEPHDFDKTVARSCRQVSDSKRRVFIIRTDVENHHSECQECFIWIRVDNMKLGEKMLLSCCVGLSDFQIMSPGGECFAPLRPLEKNDSRHFVRHVAVAEPLRLHSRPGVDTVGIYIKNHYNRNRECFIWIRFDHRKLNEKGYLPLLREDPLICECPWKCFAPFSEKLRTLIMRMRRGARHSLARDLT